MDKPSSLWFLAPLIFGLLGGVIAYGFVHTQDKRMAEQLFLTGVIMFLINILILVLVL